MSGIETDSTVAEPGKRHLLENAAKLGFLAAASSVINRASSNTETNASFIPSQLSEVYQISDADQEKIFREKVEAIAFDFEYQAHVSTEQVYQYRSTVNNSQEDDVLNLIVFTGFTTDSTSFWKSGYDYTKLADDFSAKLGKDVRIISSGMSTEVENPDNYPGDKEADLFTAGGKTYRHWTAPSLQDYPRQLITKVVDKYSSNSKLLISGYSAGTNPAMQAAIHLVSNDQQQRIVGVQLGALAPGKFIQLDYMDQLRAIGGKRLREKLVKEKYQLEWPILKNFTEQVITNGTNVLVSHGTNDEIPSVSLLSQFAADKWKGNNVTHKEIQGANHSHLPHILIFEGAPGDYLTAKKKNSRLTSFSRRKLFDTSSYTIT